MRVYKTGEIRNVAVVGHGASGKTSLVDALAFVAGTSKRHGSVKDGTALTDYTPDEIDRKYSINLAVAVAEWRDTKLNLIDTPGYLDFTGEALAGVCAADGAVVVVSATGGVEVGTEKVWDYAAAREVPRLFFVSLMDKEHADFERVYDQIKQRLTPKVIPVEIPVGEGPEFHGVINLFSQKCHMYTKGTKTGEYEEVDVPAGYQDRFARYSKELIERIAETDDTLLERYLGGEEIGRDEAIAAMKVGMAKGELFPLFCGAAELTYGTRALLSKLVELVPAPNERPPVDAQKWGSAERLALPAADGGPFVAQVFKTISEPHVGDVTYFRVYSGTVRNGQDVYNAPRTASEKLNHLCVTVGKDRVEIAELHAGDLGVVAKLRDTHTNDTLSTKDVPIVLRKIPFPEPVITEAIEVRQRGEEEKLSNGLHKLHEEDPTFQHEYNGELQQMLIRGLGERHLEIIVGRLARKFGVHALITKPKVAYRETFKGKAEGQGKHKKQTGGRGQYGDCWIRIAPLPRGSGVQFADEIVGGVIPRQYIPAVERGIQEAAGRGPVAGYPVVDFKVELYDGSYHDVDSNEQSFKMAGILAFRNVSPNARPTLLEPILELEVWTPDEYQGAVMGDLSSRRGHILGTEPDGRLTKVKALVPEAELDKYATVLHSLTHGRGTYRQKFHVYQEVPPEVAHKVVDARKKELEQAKAS
ncbi:MAG TPA: elongation factor G [Gemmatimonadales bacterium]|nr:elongation factor G [Gemmatimonadales bacterium]